VTDTTEQGEDPTASLLKKINKTLRKYFDVRRQRAEHKLTHDKKLAKLKTKFDQVDQPLATLEAELAAKLRGLIIPNRVKLIIGKRKAFATTFGVVSFSKKPLSFKVTDPKGLEKLARKERRLNKLGKFVRTWKHNAKSIDTWLKADPEAAARYAAFVEKTGDYDELFVQPTDPYLTQFDPDQLTAKSVNLGPAPDDVKDESPDA
jgi:hypothetical protein